MAKSQFQLGIVVGIDTDAQNNKGYRVLIANVTKIEDNQYNWDFKAVMFSEQQLMQSLIQGNKYINVTLDNNKIKGKPASLDRFNNKMHTHVIISQLVNEEKRILGYKVASGNGSVKNIPIKELVAYGERITKLGEVPVQNAIFIHEDKNKKGYYKSYPDSGFITELVKSNRKSNNTDNRRVNVQKNEKTLSKLDEIYSKDQIDQLRLGKQHGVDIRVFANPQLTAKQMETLRDGLEQKINVRPFAFPEYDHMVMKTYILDLKAGLNIKGYLNPKYTLDQIAELSLANELGLDISKMSNPKLKSTEMAEIRERLENNIWRDELVKKDGSWI